MKIKQKKQKLIPYHFNLVLSFLILIGLFTNQSCIEPFHFELPESDNRLVVDGFISTEMKAHEVRLNMTTSYNNSIKYDPVYGANVKIISDLGDIYNLTELYEGRYVTETIAAEIGRSYKLSIETFSGKIYESGFEQIVAISPFEEVQYEYKVDEFSGSGILVYVKNIEQPGIPVYLLWNYTGHQEITRLYEDAEDTLAGQLLYYCITTEVCDGCINVSSNKFTNNQLIAKVPYTSKKKYIIKIDKNTISPIAYKFFTQINNLVKNSGTVFDSPSTLVRGNIINIQDEDEVVHGYFYASDRYTKIFTIDRNIFSEPPEPIKVLIPKPCLKDPVTCALYPLVLPDPPPCVSEPPIYWYD
jgi:hypothetical protein